MEGWCLSAHLPPCFARSVAIPRMPITQRIIQRALVTRTAGIGIYGEAFELQNAELPGSDSFA